MLEPNDQVLKEFKTAEPLNIKELTEAVEKYNDVHVRCLNIARFTERAILPPTFQR